MKLLLLNAAQERQLREMVQETANKLIELDFATPANDQEVMRRHVYLSGRLHALGEILRDEFPAPDLPNPETESIES
jgi:hypothetical protein